MTALQIAILATLAIAAGRLTRGRQLAMLAVSALAVFWLQPPEPFLALRFWFPVATLGVTVLSWAATATPEVRGWRRNWQTAAVLLAVILLVALTRYLHVESLPVQGIPAAPVVLAALLAFAALTLMMLWWRAALRLWRILGIGAIVGAFIVLKSPQVSQWITTTAANLRGGQASDVSTPLAWLGFSYLAFRLLHTIRDRQAGRLPPVTLVEYANYAVFFPAFTSGPIDRVERFVKDLRSPLALCDEDWIYAGRRLLVGLFKKFVIADLLAVISINDVLVSKVQAGGWLWVFLYAYALRIYFDFSGYTDLAIGMGRLLGVQLPENFTAPYLKPNLTQFWNSWHITLTQWFRSYVFNPMTRALRSLRSPLPVWLVILATQLVTMVLIGLWHGITWGFAAWGAWHAVGLFIHNRWAEFSRNRMPLWTQIAPVQKALSVISVFVTFNYVALGWLFFTLRSPEVAFQAMRRLFGLA